MIIEIETNRLKDALEPKGISKNCSFFEILLFKKEEP
jgi:hypothetical protein